MVRLTEYELRIIAKNRGIKNYLNMSREKLLGTIDKYDHIIENLSKNELEKIVKMQNLSLKKLQQIVRMNNFSENKLKEIANIRSIKKIRRYVQGRFLNCSFKI